MLTHEWVLENFEYRSDGLYWRTSNHSRKAGTKAGTTSPDDHRQISITFNGIKKIYKEHRLCWFYMTGQWPKELIDHIDRNPSNNAWSNLRQANKSQNGMNKNVLGITKRKDCNRWQAQLKENGRSHYLGLFDTKEEAIAVRRAAELQYFGEFAPKD